MQIDLSVVVPCYNEEEGLAELHRRVTAACKASVGTSYELLLVNDGSRDATWTTMQQLALSDPRIKAVNLSRNHGHQLALTAGLSVCRGDRILIIDGDLQDPPELLGEMMRQMDQGADVVYGQRASRAGETWFKRASAALFYRLLSNITDVDIPLDTGDFRLMSRRSLDVLNSMPEPHRFVRGMVSWVGFKQVPVVYERAERFAGETKYPLHKMVRFAIDAITGFSIQPLRVSIYFSMLIGLAALCLLLYTFVSYVYFNAVQGWTSLISVVLLLGSAQMLVLGIIGEYLGRLYMQGKQRPLFIISDVVTQQSPRLTVVREDPRSTAEPARMP